MDVFTKYGYFYEARLFFYEAWIFSQSMNLFLYGA
jgi:hypothetical protein